MQGADPPLHLGGDPEAQPEDGQVAGDRAQGVQCHPVGSQAPGGPPSHQPLRRGRCHGKERTDTRGAAPRLRQQPLTGRCHPQGY